MDAGSVLLGNEISALIMGESELGTVPPLMSKTRLLNATSPRIKSMTPELL